MIIRLAAIVLALFFPLVAGAQSVVPQSQSEVKLSFAPVVKAVAPAVVNIYTKRTVVQSAVNPFFRDPFFSQFFGNNVPGQRMRKQAESSLGSGVIIEADGLVVTNAHVVKGAEEITVGLNDGREFEAELVLVDAPSDLALLRIDPAGEALPFASLRPSESLEVGDLVLAIGNPFGVGQTVTSGIVSAQGRSSLNINDFNFFIQTDAAINPGNSGGALVTLDGGVVGINTAIYSRNGGSLGIGFAIPSEMVASVIAAEKAGSNGASGIARPWLGVTAQGVTQDIADSLDLKTPRGALISHLHSASPLKAAGIQVGDVVLSLNDKEVRSPSEMKFRMATVPLGDEATMLVERKGKSKSYKVKAMAPPDSPPRSAITLSGQHYLSGATIANINPAVAVELGLSEEEGVVVMALAAGSPAARILNPGDIVLDINGAEIKAPKDVEKAAQAARSLSVIVKTNGRTRRVFIR
ncbi:MAG: Do family serine endopeptidase [Alphaproteobacteria bacterium]|nr:Do family serine endopeptidase [Alphaproteobacteria bacterium]